MRAKLLTLSLLFAACLAPLELLWAQSAAPEYQLKAAYIYNFVKFTEWPASALSAGTTLNVCPIGRDTMGDALNSLEGKSAQNHTVRVVRGLQTDNLRGCHVVFVATSDKKELSEISRAAEADSILTISDQDGFLENSGMIFLVTTDKRIQFDVNIEASQNAGLKISSHVLKLARTIKGKSQ